MRPIFYVAHPYVGLMENLDRARRWMHYLIVRNATVDFCAPWITWCEVFRELDDPFIRNRGLEFDCEMVKRCDGVVLCGGRVSRGMRLEADAAVIAGKPVIDLTDFGEEPPGYSK